MGLVLSLSSLALTPLHANLTFSADNFEQVDYGTSPISINGLSGGEGWASSWTLFKERPSFFPAAICSTITPLAT
jgi:hypothetical protein